MTLWNPKKQNVLVSVYDFVIGFTQNLIGSSATWKITHFFLCLFTFMVIAPKIGL